MNAHDTCASALPSPPYTAKNSAGRYSGATADVVGPEEVLACVRGKVAESRVVRALHDAGAEVSSADFATAVERWSSRVNMLDAARDVRVMGKLGCRLIVRGGSEWAPALDDLGDERPLGVWVRGSGSLRAMASKAIALVGGAGTV